mgnify:CR=1 FL=1
MEVNTFCNEPEERQPSAVTYWRRRFLALVVGLVVLAIVAWAFSGSLGVRARPAASTGAESHGHHPARHPARAAAAASGTSLAGTSAAGSPNAAGASGRGGSGSGNAPGSGAGGHASAAPGSSATPPSSGTLPNPGQNAAAAPGEQRPCRPGDVVLSLSASQASYGPGQLPEFDVDVVSTAARTCAFDVGPRYLALAVTARGKRIWSSADCVGGRGSLLTSLARGVPTVLPVSWDRETSAPGCTGPSRPAPGGSYAVTASDGGVASKSVPFTLS